MERNQTILEIIQTTVPGWQKVTEDTCKITRLTSNSSQVFLVQTTYPTSPNEFIFRFFGSSDTLNPSNSSKVLQKLSDSGLSPKIYKESSVFRLEEYLQGFQSLSFSDLFELKLLQKISEKLKNFHSLDMSESFDRNSLVCVENCRKWRNCAKNLVKNLENSEDFSVFEGNSEELEKVKDALGDEYWEMFLNVLPRMSPVVFSHMDTSYLNILFNPGKDEVFLLDFDYSGYSFRGFDLAMMFTDLKYDYSYSEPPYFKYNPDAYPGDEFLTECIKAYGGDSRMFNECKLCMIASHYLWSMWAFSLISQSEGMNMFQYGLLRFSEFTSSYESQKP